MIRHEDIGVNLPARLDASLAQRVDEALAIRIIHEDPFAPVTAIHDVKVASASLRIDIKNCPLLLTPFRPLLQAGQGVVSSSSKSSLIEGPGLLS
jgi:hypothetical protein